MTRSKLISILLFSIVVILIGQLLPSTEGLLKTISSQQKVASQKEISPVLTTPKKKATKISKIVVKQVNLPEKPDFSSIKDTHLKKKTFFKFMYENVKLANAKVLKERHQILALQKTWLKESVFNGKQSQLFQHFEDKYRINEKLPTQQKFTNLLIKVDAVAPSLVLAQSANESAWGTSRFAKLGNNFFGQWCYRKGCGIVPSRRNEGSTHEVASFHSVLKSVDEYLFNINVSRSYKLIRKIRAQQRNSGQPVMGVKLAEGLIRYSERREAYVKEIQSMIRFNKLSAYDTRINVNP